METESKLKAEAMETARKIIEKEMRKCKGNLAQIYATIEATASALEESADTPGQIKKAIAYTYARKDLEETIVNVFMKNAGYTYRGEDQNPLRYSWRKAET